MTKTQRVLLAGAALALTATAALAANLPAKKAQLPRMVQTVAYSESLLPQFAVLQDSVVPPNIFPAAAFADMTRMMAAMDRDMDRMMGEARALMTMPDNMPHNTVLMEAPGGNEDYSVTAIGAGGNVCGREVTITSTGNSARPKIVSRSFGNCGGSVPDGSGTQAAHDIAGGLLQARFTN
jgi:hypothetical protein